MFEVEDGRAAAVLAERLVHAVAERDVQAALGLCAEGVDYEAVGIDRYRGHAGIRDLVADQASVFSVAVPTVRSVIARGVDVAMEIDYSLVMAGGILALPTAAFFTVAGGLVTTWREYQDTRDLSRALGY